jgi:hypothetical protein
MKYIVILIIMISGMFSAELPRDAQRELDSFNVAVAKADAVRQAAINVAVDKAVKALNTVAKNADTAEERRAVDDQILELKKLKVEEDLLGDNVGLPAPLRGLVGKWAVAISGDRANWDIKADGTVAIKDFTHRSELATTWEYKKKEGIVHVPFGNGHWADIVLPIDPKGTKGDNSFYGKNSATFTKIEGKP